MPIPKDELKTAKISAPYDKWAGLLHRGTVPTVCVSIETHNGLGMQFTGGFLFSVENGEVHRLATGNLIIDKCPPFAPFYEVRNS